MYTNGHTSQNSQMPTLATNGITLAYSILTAYHHGGIEAAAYVYMEL